MIIISHFTFHILHLNFRFRKLSNTRSLKKSEKHLQDSFIEMMMKADCGINAKYSYVIDKDFVFLFFNGRNNYHFSFLHHLFSLFDYLLVRSEEHTSELQSLMRISYAVFCLKTNKNIHSNYSIFFCI